MASINGEEAAAPSINPLLLESARIGSWRALDFLFRWEDAQNPPMMIPSREIFWFLERPSAAPDVDEGVTPPSGDTVLDVVPAAPDVEEGVTPHGDTALDVVPAAPDIEEGVTPHGDTALDVVPAALDIEEGVTSGGYIAPPVPPAAHGVEEGVTSDRNTAPAAVADARDVEEIAPPAAAGTAARDVEERVTPDGDTAPLAVPPASDVAEPVDQHPASLAAAQELLKGVTPDGETALHVVASNGDDKRYLDCARLICRRDRDLLFAKNHNGDTPLHCAARAGNSEMVSCLIALAGPGAGSEDQKEKLRLLRIENKRHETALHEAVRFEDGKYLGPEDRGALFDAYGRPEETKIKAYVEQQGMTIVKKLMGDDPRLADYPVDGISPLYLAILLNKSSIAVTLYHVSGGNLSYFGLNGQNALHVAVLQDQVMMVFLLYCQKSLTTQVDRDGRTPLHFACFTRSIWDVAKVFQANRAALYQADNNGFFPIHVAASNGCIDVVCFLLGKRPDSAGLRNAKGMTFLHVAIEKRRCNIVSYVCGNPSLARILNMQDNQGNTALHLAIEAGSIKIFCALLGNPEVNLNLPNYQGEAPRDVSLRMFPREYSYVGNSEILIHEALKSVGAFTSISWVKTWEEYTRRPKPEEEDKESERLKDATHTYTVASVLITAMAFSAIFSIPGGYRADDHTNGGTPTLAGRYIFDAFTMATTLALLCASLATVGFMFAGNPIVNLTTRVNCLQKSTHFVMSSVTCLSLAFALAVYMVLAPVARNTAFVVCLIISVVPVYMYIDGPQILVILARPIFIRKGLKQGMKFLLHRGGSMIAIALWPFMLSFGWAAFAKIRWTRVHLKYLGFAICCLVVVSCIVSLAWAVWAKIQWRRLFSRVNPMVSKYLMCKTG